MTLGQVLQQARQRLEEGGIEEAGLEAEILLRHTLDIDRAALYASLNESIDPPCYSKYKHLLDRRLKGEPAAYITGHREFFGLDFFIDRRVLIPRPETELLVETAIAWCRKFGYETVADIGTGSGVIAVSLAVNLPGMRIIATDISTDALDVARRNSRRHEVEKRIKFLHGYLYQPFTETVDLVCANLPYVPKSDLDNHDLSGYEPRIALNGGIDGMDLLREFCRNADAFLKPGGGALLEIGSGQALEIAAELHKNLPAGEVGILRDLADIERIVWFRLT